MSNVAIVTDSTAYIPENLLQKYSIHVAPQVLIWGDETFEDGVDILPDEYYKRLETAQIMPSTSQVTPKTFERIFSQLIEQGSQILAILVANKLSGTISSATQIKNEMPKSKIEILDSNTTAMALGFQVLLAARAAADGASMDECISIAKEAQKHTGVVFAVDTLEFLHRGGRIGGASRYLGAALNLKPILEVVDGKIEAIERVRTRKKSLARLLTIVGERIDGNESFRFAAIHANSPEDARYLLQALEEKYNPIETIFSGVSPVIGTHAGPGTVAIAYCCGM
jgi:DegV family protein with EDD domain